MVSLYLYLAMLRIARYVFCWPTMPLGTSLDLHFMLILSLIGRLPTFAVGLVLAMLYTRITPWQIPAVTANLALFAEVMLLGWVLLPAALFGASEFVWDAPWHIWL